MGEGVELVAVRVTAVTAGFEGLRSKLNCIFRPAFSKAVIGGMAVCYMFVCVCVCVHMCR